MPTAETVETNLAGVRALLPPPRAFDPSKASDVDLARYGLPPRPDPLKSPQVFASWKRWVEASTYRIVPQLKQTEVYHGPAKHLSIGKPIAAGPTPATSSNWSGFVITDPANIFNQVGGYVQGTFVVPKGLTCVVAADYHSSNWVGIDGLGTSDVFQLGTSTDVNCYAGAEAHYAWIEWYPSPSSMVTNLTVEAGDIVTVSAAATPAQNRFEVNYANWSTRQSMDLLMTPPPGTHLVGNCIEWIVERPDIDGATSNLTPFFLNSWTAMDGFFQQGNALLHYRPSAPPTGVSYLLTMTSGTTKLASVTLYPGQFDDSGLFQSFPNK